MSLTIYEHPLSEKLRTYMRIEHLFHQLNVNRSLNQEMQYIPFFDGLFSLLDVLDRNDIRNDLVKDLEKNEKRLVQWSQHPEVCDTALQSTLQKVIQLQSDLMSVSRCIGELKDDTFLSGVKQRFSIPGGHCAFDLPHLHFWLSSNETLRNEKISQWFSLIAPFNEAITIVLTLAREQSQFTPLEAEQGFYQGNTEDFEFLRIKYQPEDGIFPTVSGNKYRYAIRFMRLCDEQGKANVDTPVLFQLACC